VRRRSKAGGKPVKTRRRKAVALKRRNAPKAMPRRSSSTAREDTEVTRLTRELNEALEQQTATSDVLQVISSSPGELEPVFATMLANAVRICDAKFGNIFRWDGDVLRLIATHNTPPAFAEVRRRLPLRTAPENLIGRMVATKMVVHVADLAAEQAYVDQRSPQYVAAVELGGVRTFLAVPMLRENELVGAFILYREEVRPFADKQIALVTSFASQAVIAIENTRLLNELRQSLEQQTATSEVLKVVSTSPGDLQPVFTTILENAVRICEANFGNLFLYEEDAYRVVAMHNAPEAYVNLRTDAPIRPPPGTALSRVAATKQAAQIADLMMEEVYIKGVPLAVTGVSQAGIRTLLAVPMLKDDRLMGAIVIYRREVRPFEEKQIKVLENFAAQAVIAIENARLLNELRESLEQQTATADVLEVISRSAFDLQAVFETVAESSVRLCGADRAFIFRFDGELLRMVVAHNASPEFAEWVANHPIRPGRHSGSARAALEHRTIHIPDVLADPEYVYGAKDVEPIRTILGVPILKGDDLLGVMMIYRLEVRPFTDKQIALVETFADQAAIAIENVRLLEELRRRTEQVEAQSHELVKLNQQLEQRVADQVGEIERMGRLRRFLPPQVADLIVASGSEKQLESHRREITALFCDLRGFTGFSESADPEDVMALLRDYHGAIGEIIIKYSGTLERYAGDGVMVVFNDPVPVEKPALQAVLMALEMRDVIGTLTEKWRRLGHDIGFGIGIAHGFATLGTIGFEGRFDYAAIGTVSNVASRLCDEAKPGQILISPRVFMAVEDAVSVEPVGEFTLKGIRRPLAAYNVLAAASSRS
jgi:GAF domain-containing protein